MPPAVVSSYNPIPHHRLSIYDTPTPPSQSYSIVNNKQQQPAGGGVDENHNNVVNAAGKGNTNLAANALLQTSLRPLSKNFNQQYMSTVLPKSRLSQQHGPPHFPSNKSGQHHRQLDLDDTTTSASSTALASTDGFGDISTDNRMPSKPKAAAAPYPDLNDENYDSVGYGDAGMGVGQLREDKDRFIDLDHRKAVAASSRRATTRGGTGGGRNFQGDYREAKRTRVDEYSDATVESSQGEEDDDVDDDDEFSLRLGGKMPMPGGGGGAGFTNATSTPFVQPSFNNISKSAFDGMARELRKEFERIMDVGNQPPPAPLPAPSATATSSSQTHHSTASQLQHPRQKPLATNTNGQAFSTRQLASQPSPPAPLPSSNRHAAPPPGVQSLPRGVQPRRKQQGAASPAANRSSGVQPGSPRRDTTPTSNRTFGQNLPTYHQGYTSGSKTTGQPALDSNAYPSAPSFPSKVDAFRTIGGAQDYLGGLSPFQVSAAPAAGSGLLPPNNTRATSASPILQHQGPFQRNSHVLSDAIPFARPNTAAPFPTHRSTSAPTYLDSPSSRHQLFVPDVTGLTEGLASPSKINSGPSSHRPLPSSVGASVGTNQYLHKSVEDPALSSALASLRRRLEQLEAENLKSEERVRELESQLRADAPPKATPSFDHQAATNPSSSHQQRSRRDDLITALNAEIARLQASIQRHSLALNELQAASAREGLASFVPSDFDGYKVQTNGWNAEYLSLKDALNVLTKQVSEVKAILEEVLANVKQLPQQHPRDKELLGGWTGKQPFDQSSPPPRVQATQTSIRPQRQHSSPAYNYAPNYQGPVRGVQQAQQERASSAPPANIAYRVQRDPQQNEPLLDRAERILRDLPPTIDQHLAGTTTCEVCQRRARTDLNQPPLDGYAPDASFNTREQQRQQLNRGQKAEDIPMQAVISRALRELEADFASHKKIYIELSEEYKIMDPAALDVGKRRILASHLKESIDVLELKADEIKRLYDLLHYRGELQQSHDVQRLRTMAQATTFR